MKYIVLILLTAFLSFSYSSYGQEKELTRKERKMLEKQKRAQQDSLLSIQIEKSLNEKKWVLEAHQLSNKQGNTVIVNSTLNFIAIEGDEAYVQLGRNSGMGPNGVGGITVRANISKYEIKKTKKGYYYITIALNASVGNFDIRINMAPTGQMASATVQGYTSRRVNYTGNVVPLELSTVYKGTSIY